MPGTTINAEPAELAEEATLGALREFRVVGSFIRLSPARKGRFASRNAEARSRCRAIPG
jgi:hypothetical protein